MKSVETPALLLVSVFRLGIGELFHGIARSPASKFRSSNSYRTFVVALGLREGNAVPGVIGQAHAEAVGLDAAVAFAFPAGPVRRRSKVRSPLRGSPSTT